MAIEAEAQAAYVDKIREEEAKVKKLDRLQRKLLILSLAFTGLISLVSAVLWVLAEGEDAMGAPIGFTGFIGAFGMFIVGFIAAVMIYSCVLVAPISIIIGIILSERMKKLNILKANPPA